jgi:hypothetical protein
MLHVAKHSKGYTELTKRSKKHTFTPVKVDPKTGEETAQRPVTVELKTVALTQPETVPAKGFTAKQQRMIDLGRKRLTTSNPARK